MAGRNPIVIDLRHRTRSSLLRRRIFQFEVRSPLFSHM